jgi:hypothetical protein
MRFATNSANGGFRNWAVDHAKRYLVAYPGADGLFLDNSYSRLQADATGLRESTAKYADDYASLARSIDSGIGTKWILANTSGSGDSAEPLAKYGISYVDEFALRPLGLGSTKTRAPSKRCSSRRRLESITAARVGTEPL